MLETKVGQIWKWKTSEDSNGFLIISMPSHPSQDVTKNIVVYTPVGVVVSSPFWRTQEDFEEIMEYVKTPKIDKPWYKKILNR